MKKIIVAILLCAAITSCEWGRGSGSGQGTSAQGNSGGGKKNPPAAKTESAIHPFPVAVVPSVFGTDREEARQYLLEHYWDAFLKGEGRTDPATILGVRGEEVEQALSNYIQLLYELKMQSTPEDMSPLKKAQGSVRHFFVEIEARQQSDTASHVYPRMTELVTLYLYDPNSPMRDEDLYFPFAEAMAVSPCTRDDMRAAARYEARMCLTNSFGSKAPNFQFSDIKGHKSNLYSVNADLVMLFFSNPGCESCKQIISDVKSRQYIPGLIKDGKLAIINIYIDEEVAKWREYSHNYPSDWINGYDYTFTLRDSGLYDIRAIPSLYLLDASKRVIMKDAPTEKVLKYLDNL